MVNDKIVKLRCLNNFGIEKLSIETDQKNIIISEPSKNTKIVLNETETRNLIDCLKLIIQD